MFFGKCEKKKHGTKAVLLVGMLAAIGALSITKKGKEMMCCAKDKLKNFFKKECKSEGCNCNEE